ncbi:MAG: primosomal protein N' [Erysipelotrichaceae bacterium]|nr:primosomal protein N' [Erysipelotrichaceae bacterium]MDY6035327.1 primosomal protein N' [Bulleidia sp.]
MKIVECWLEHPVRRLDQTYSYLYDGAIEVGSRITIPLLNRKVTGFVESYVETDESKEEIEKRLGYRLRYILECKDQESLITDELHDLAFWMKENTLSTTISCFQTMLPSKLKPVSNDKKVVKEKWVKVTDHEVTLTPKQLEAFLYARDHQPITYTAFRKLYPSHAHTLITKNAIVLEEKDREAREDVVNVQACPTLKPLQKKAMDDINSSHDSIYLLHGVTGSGKTEVYLQLAAQTLAKGRQVLILVPEIGLTPQMIQRVSSRFGKGLAIYHSGLNDQEKYEQYRKVKMGKASIVVGTRSAVFLPFQDLGLIVMDEEHDSSYKQENQPAYHCRDIAIWRGNYHGCKVILGSATPALESYARALKAVYHLVEMKERINQNLPKIEVVSIKDEIKKNGSYILTRTLQEKIQQRLDSNEQIILLLNRRGFVSQVRCKECQEVVMCPHCDIAMSYHRDVKRLKCHTCGTEMSVPQVCPSCHSRAGFSTYGFGTEKLEAEVHACFPKAKVLRMDADTTSRKNAHQKILDAFGKHEADILLGTQMIAKGLDYPDVTLVGIINGDEGLQRTDFRSCETTFDLLMQASGRSGRGHTNGEVVLQVFDPKHYAVQCASKQDYETFFKKEMQYRHLSEYPPYTYLISLTIQNRKDDIAMKLASRIKREITGNFKVIGVISLLKIQDFYRYRLVLKGKNLEAMKQAVREFLINTKLDLSGLRIDVNPIYLD